MLNADFSNQVSIFHSFYSLFPLFRNHRTGNALWVTKMASGMDLPALIMWKLFFKHFSHDRLQLKYSPLEDLWDPEYSIVARHSLSIWSSTVFSTISSSSQNDTDCYSRTTSKSLKAPWHFSYTREKTPTCGKVIGLNDALPITPRLDRNGWWQSSTKRPKCEWSNIYLYQA